MPEIRFRGRDSTFRIGDEVCSLWRGDIEVPIRRREWQVLKYLAERPNTLVTREELKRVVWAGVNVADGSVHVALAELRRWLGDSPEAPQFIKAVPKQGWMFVAEIEPVGGRTQSDDSQTTPAPGPTSGSVGAPQKGERAASGKADSSRPSIKGSDSITLRIWSPDGRGGSIAGSVSLRWDEIIAAIGPIVLQPCTESRIERNLTEIVVDKKGEQARLYDSGFRLVLTHLFAANILEPCDSLPMSTVFDAHHRTIVPKDYNFWRLTDSGRDYLKGLLMND